MELRPVTLHSSLALDAGRVTGFVVTAVTFTPEDTAIGGELREDLQRHIPKGTMNGNAAFGDMFEHRITSFPALL